MRSVHSGGDLRDQEYKTVGHMTSAGRRQRGEKERVLSSLLPSVWSWVLVLNKSSLLT